MAETMKAIVYRGPEQMVVEDVEKPVAGPTDVIVKTKYASICGGELHTYRCGYGQKPGRILGHEYIGYAEEVGAEVEGIEVGDRVWGMNYSVCGTCWYCENGEYANCSKLLDYCTGNGIPGGHAQYVKLAPAILGQTIHKIPDSIPDTHAALIEPFGVGADEVAGNVKEGDKVVVIGCGMIGNAIIQFAKLAGAASITAVDVSPARLEIAKLCGAEYTINSAEEDVLEAIQKIYGPNAWFYGESGRCDVAFETAGVANTLNNAIDCVRAGGKVVLVAPSEHNVNLNLAAVINKQPQFVIPVSGSHVADVIDAMANGKLVVEPLITDIFPYYEATKAFETQSRPEKGMKALIQMDAE